MAATSVTDIGSGTLGRPKPLSRWAFRPNTPCPAKKSRTHQKPYTPTGPRRPPRRRRRTRLPPRESPWIHCLHPPTPPETHPVKRTAAGNAADGSRLPATATPNAPLRFGPVELDNASGQRVGHAPVAFGAEVP